MFLKIIHCLKINATTLNRMAVTALVNKLLLVQRAALTHSWRGCAHTLLEGMRLHTPGGDVDKSAYTLLEER